LPGTGISINGATISGNYTGSNGVAINGNTITGNYTAGSGININGSTISGNYVGSNGVAVNGNSISGNYIAGSGITINGSTISHALQAGSGININGATISHNLQAGSGISITGNTISATGSSTGYWLPHTNGIYYNANQVGIGTTPTLNVGLTVSPVNPANGASAIMHLRSSDTWHSAVTMFNGSGSAQKWYSLIVAGPINTNLPYGGFGLINHMTQTWGYNFDGTTNYMAVGSPSANANTPKSRLHIFLGDVNIDQIGSGIIMKSPNGNCWRITVDNSGNLVRTAIACP
jgi:hypothetical protein